MIQSKPDYCFRNVSMVMRKRQGFQNIKSITRYNVFRLYINIEYRHKVKSRKICCDLF